jgi:putative oxidoreductase
MSQQSLRTRFNAMADRNQEWSWALLRILGSAMFITHGWGKLFGERAQSLTNGMTSLNLGELISIPTGINLLWIAGVVEVFGGLLLVVGLFTRPLALIAAVQMVFAYLIAHPAWFPTLNRGELAAMYLLVYLVIFAYGPGRYSVDAWLAKRPSPGG